MVSIAILNYQMVTTDRGVLKMGAFNDGKSPSLVSVSPRWPGSLQNPPV